MDPIEEIIRHNGPRRWPTAPVRHSPRWSPNSPTSSPLSRPDSAGMQSPPPCTQGTNKNLGPSPFTKCLRSMGTIIPSPPRQPSQRFKRQLFPISPDGKKTMKVNETTRILRSADIISPTSSINDSGYLSSASLSSSTPGSSIAQNIRKTGKAACNVRKRLSFRRI